MKHTTALTVADLVADLLDNDGQKFESQAGNSLQDMCEVLGGFMESRGADRKFSFPDGSCITISEGTAWDVGYEDCWCWQSIGHSDNCVLRQVGLEEV